MLPVKRTVIVIIAILKFVLRERITQMRRSSQRKTRKLLWQFGTGNQCSRSPHL
jgi:hypothetical protein